MGVVNSCGLCVWIVEDFVCVYIYIYIFVKVFLKIILMYWIYYFNV